MQRAPDFRELEKVLRRERPSRPVLFEFIMNPPVLERLAGARWIREAGTPDEHMRNLIAGFEAGGYDHAAVYPWWMGWMRFPSVERAEGESVGMAHGGVITDAASFAAYDRWPDAEALDLSVLDRARDWLPSGMKLIVMANCGVLENVTNLAGYEDLCFLLADEPEVARRLFAEVGSRILRFYERCVEHETVGAVVVNDDWGFKTQLFLSPEQMREHVFPWHRRMVEAAHRAGRPAILHSCGQMELVWEDIIGDLRFDAKHSFEDTILPVERAMDRFGRRIAILGGLDLDFLCRSTPEQVKARARGLVGRMLRDGGYALGSGNSIAEYVPWENYMALRAAALEA